MTQSVNDDKDDKVIEVESYTKGMLQATVISQRQNHTFGYKVYLELQQSDNKSAGWYGT